MAWDTAILQSGRIVQVHSYKDHLRSSASQPALLPVNRESRDLMKTACPQSSNQRLYFHPQIDTLYIDARSFLFDSAATLSLVRQLPQSFKTAVRRFALGTGYLAETPGVLRIAALFPN